MSKESLEKVRAKIIELLNDESMDSIDKMELLINLYNFLDPEKYDKNIQILRKMP